MGSDLEKGTTYSDGDQVNAGNLNAHVDNATIKYTAISSRSLKDPAGLGDELLINDSGTLKKITLQQISSLVVIPSGTMVDYAGVTEPTGWLLCYGQAISRVTYSALFIALGSGTIYGAGDGSTTFLLPDCRGRVVAGKDNMGGSSADRLAAPLNGDILGAVGGAERITLTASTIPAHTHTVGDHTHAVGQSVTVASGANYTVPALGTFTYSTQAAGATTTSSIGSGTGHDNLPPTIVLNKIIKT